MVPKLLTEHAHLQLGRSWFCQSGQTDLHPIREQSIPENLFICKGDQQLHHPPELQHVLHQLVGLTGDWQLGVFCPVLKGLCIGEGLLQLCNPVVLTAKLQIWRQHKLVYFQGWGGQQCRVVIVYPLTWLCTFGSSNNAHTFCANSQW